MAFYNDMQKIADTLLTQYGQDIQLIDASKTVIETYQGIKAPVRVQNTPTTVIEASQATVYITHGVTVPDITNYLLINGDIWKIIWIEPVQPTNVTVLYTLFVSK